MHEITEMRPSAKDIFLIYRHFLFASPQNGVHRDCNFIKLNETLCAENYIYISNNKKNRTKQRHPCLRLSNRFMCAPLHEFR